MDPLLLDDINADELFAEEPAETGLRLKSAALRAALRDASESEIDEALERWLAGDEPGEPG